MFARRSNELIARRARLDDRALLVDGRKAAHSGAENLREESTIAQRQVVTPMMQANRGVLFRFRESLSERCLRQERQRQQHGKTNEGHARRQCCGGTAAM